LVLDRYELPEDPQELRLLREQEEPLILGLESREDMKTILDEDSAFVTEMEAYLEEWADSIYDLIKTRYAIAKATKRKVTTKHYLRNDSRRRSSSSRTHLLSYQVTCQTTFNRRIKSTRNNKNKNIRSIKLDINGVLNFGLILSSLF
jgi:hypothetical protein